MIDLISERIPLSELKPGQEARIHSLLCEGAMRQRFLDLGFLPGVSVSCTGQSPSGDPKAFLIRGAVIAIRSRDSRDILTEVSSSGEKLIALAGCPNVGKSTLFNALTGLSQHTGNWPGKTVEQARGHFRTALYSCCLVDTPGAYSLSPHSPEEEITRDFLCFGGAEAVIAVCDASCLARSLPLVLQILEAKPRTLLCVNLMDEAERFGIELDLKTLSEELGIPVVGVTARDKRTLSALTEALDRLLGGPGPSFHAPVLYPEPLEAVLQTLEPLMRKVSCLSLPARYLSLRLLEKDPAFSEDSFLCPHSFSGENPAAVDALSDAQKTLLAAGFTEQKLQDSVAASLLHRSEELSRKAVKADDGKGQKKTQKLDRILTGKLFGYPAMLLLLALTLFITIEGANYPSRLLSSLLFRAEEQLASLFFCLHAPEWLTGLLVRGAYRVTAWVVSVMLPPMAVFFPLFTFLEDAGYLPRVAYNLDHAFQRCRSCGKQALTLCMSFGCNAVGVTGCRIIDSPRERMIAILTSSFVPCNGRFPTLIALLTMFFVGAPLTPSGAGSSGNGVPSGLLPALLLTALTAGSVAAALFASRLLSHTLLKGMPSSFTLELPPYRRPQAGKILVRSLLDRTFFVLCRAVSAAAPAGILIWLLANITFDGVSILSLLSQWLTPFASVFGLDGTILLAFILGLPANEIVVPVLLMAYLEQGTLVEAGSLLSLRELLVSRGWTAVTAACMLVFTLFHWPCATTLLTVRRETGSLRWTVLAALLPTAFGLLLCFLIAQGCRLLG